MKKLLPLLALLSIGVGMGQTLTYLVPRGAGTLEPLAAGSDSSMSIVQTVYERLFGAEGTSVELVPQLATGYEVSVDGRTYTFHLREGVRFHSGNPFTCADVEYSLRRTLTYAPDTMLQAVFGPDAIDPYYFDEDTPEETYAAYWDGVENAVHCRDDLTAVVRVLEPDPLLIARLSTPFYSIVDSAYAIANGMWDGTEATWRDWLPEDLTEYHLHDHESGTGAYQVESWTPGERLVLQRFEGYWGSTPKLEAVEFKVEPDEAARVAALRAGEADHIAYFGESVPKAELAAFPGVLMLDPSSDPALPWNITVIYAALFNQHIKADSNAGIGSGKLDGAGIPPDFFSDRDVRKCFAYSLDLDAYNQALWGGDGVVPTMAMLPQFPGYDPDIPGYAFDPAKAEQHCRAAWSGALWDEGFTFTITYAGGDPNFEELGTQLKEHLAALNPKFVVELQPVQWGQYVQALNERSLPLAIMGTPPTLPDGAGFMTTWYASSGSWAGMLGYRNDEVDQLIEAARNEFDPARRAANYRQIGRLAADDVALIPLPLMPEVVVVSDKVRGAARNPLYVDLRWQELSKAE